jgi:hypothetical protein
LGMIVSVMQDGLEGAQHSGTSSGSLRGLGILPCPEGPSPPQHVLREPSTEPFTPRESSIAIANLPGPLPRKNEGFHRHSSQDPPGMTGGSRSSPTRRLDPGEGPRPGNSQPSRG